MSKKAEEQYARLLEDGMISDRLLEHPQFYRSFVRKFDEISVDGKYALDCRITEHKLSLERRGYYPSDTNGIYYGVKDITRITFEAKEFHGKPYLWIEREHSSVHSFPERGEQITNSSEIEVYEENVLLGRASFSDLPGDQYDHNLTPYLGFKKPGFNIGFILQGMIPLDISHTLVRDYVCHVAGRASYESGIVEKSTVSRRGGKYTGKSSVAAVNLENPMTIHNSADFVVYDEGMNVTYLNKSFKTPKQAREYFANIYLEAMEKTKGK